MEPKRDNNEGRNRGEWGGAIVVMHSRSLSDPTPAMSGRGVSGPSPARQTLLAPSAKRLDRVV